VVVVVIFDGNGAVALGWVVEAWLRRLLCWVGEEESGPLRRRGESFVFLALAEVANPGNGTGVGVGASSGSLPDSIFEEA